MTPALPTRRAVLLGGLGAAALAACGGSTDSPDATADPTAAPEPDDSTTASTASFFSPGFPDGLRAPAMLVPGTPQLVPVFLAADTGRPLQSDEVPAELAVQILDESGAVLDDQLLPARGQGIPSPHYSVVVDLDAAGSYAMAADVAGEQQTFGFAVVEADEVGLVQLGDPLRAVDTPTTADPRGVDPICTRQPEPCPFHDITLTDALESGKPVVALIATPAFCQTAICGPVVDLLIDEVAGRDDLVVVHAEVWQNPEVVFTPDGATEAVVAYGLGYEPSLLVADSAGVLTARLDLSWDSVELAEALSTVS